MTDTANEILLIWPDEKLSGKLKDHYSIRINNQWRIVFKWENNHSYEVEIIDYH